jgi:hypothetical protein
MRSQFSFVVRGYRVQVCFDPWYAHEFGFEVSVTFWGRVHEGFVKAMVYRTILIIMWWEDA